MQPTVEGVIAKDKKSKRSKTNDKKNSMLNDKIAKQLINERPLPSQSKKFFHTILSQ